MDKNNVVFEANTLIPLPEAEEYIIKSCEKERTINIVQEEYLIFYRDLDRRIKDRLSLEYCEPRLV
jgi:hypothetical protein